MPQVLTDSHHTRVLTDSYHTMLRPMRDKIHHLWITSNDHFTKQIHLFSNKNLFGSHTSMIICIQNSCVFLWVLNFWCHTAGFAHLDTFTSFHSCNYACLTTTNGSLTRGGVYPCLLLPDTSFFYKFFQSCNSVGLRPT